MTHLLDEHIQFLMNFRIFKTITMYKPIERKRKKVDKSNLKEETLRNYATTILLLCEDSFIHREMWTSVRQVV
jgi:hypothetical protein